MSTEKIKGRLHYWFEDRRYGFIHENRDGILVKHFLHHTNILSGEPHTNASVLFNTVDSKKGPIALDVEILAEVARG